jgi:RND family efflux transporter MFP subunit
MSARESRRVARSWFGRAALLAAGVTLGWAVARRAEASDPATAAERWETGIVEPREIGATVLATGVVRPRVGAQVAVGSRVSGVLRKLHVTVGDAVRAGQLLAELDAVEFETQVERAQAMVMNAAAERVWAVAELDRVRQLAESAAASGSELASAQRANDTAQAREREAMAALAAAHVQLDYTRIRAPIGGVVASVSTQEGETVAASFAAPTFVTIVDLSRLEVWAYVDETDIGRIAVGQRARFTVDTWPDDAFEGSVIAVRPSAEVRDNVVNYVTLVAIENRPDRVLRPEMTTTVNIMIEGRAAAQSIPNGAMRRDSSGGYVLVARGGGFERRTVAVGFRGSAFTEVLSGVQPGERVLLGSAVPCQPDPATGGT